MKQKNPSSMMISSILETFLFGYFWWRCMLFSLLMILIQTQEVNAFSISSTNNHKRTVLRATTTTISSTSSNGAFKTMDELLNGSMSWNTVLGEADRAFRLGIQLEKVCLFSLLMFANICMEHLSLFSLSVRPTPARQWLLS